jgi:hypothetical protein
MEKERKNVLVLCQRNKVPGLEGVVSNITSFVERIIGPGANIEYLTDSKQSGSADYNFELKSGSEDPVVDSFINDHIGYYSLIILQTCPFHQMEFKLIYDLLKPNGIMAFTAFNNTTSMIEIGDINRIFRYMNTIDPSGDTHASFTKHFTDVTGHETDCYLFIKNPLGKSLGGFRKRKSRKIRKRGRGQGKSRGRRYARK